jgi:hypothetical protein
MLFSRRIGAWGLGAFCAIAGGAASADTVVAKLNGVQYAGSGYTTLDLTLGSNVYKNAIAGPQMWQQTGGTLALPSVNFLTYCVEITQDVMLTNPATSYTFYTGSIDTAPTPGDMVPGGPGMGLPKSVLIQELWARHYGDVTDATSGAAFQVAIWDIVYDADFNLGAGNFKASGNLNVTNLAATWLTDVNTNATPYTTPNLIGLKSDSAQDQITLGLPPVGAPPVTPLPSTAAGAALLLGGAMVARSRRRGA